MARNLSIDEPITFKDPAIEGPPEQTTKGEAFLRTVALGVPRYIAAQACELDPATVRRWESQARELEGLAEARLTANQKRVRTFYADLQKADAAAVVFAVGMVRKHMPTHWGAAMTFLERRQREHFGRQVTISTEEGRTPAPVDEPTAKESREAFLASHVPEGIEPDSVLPSAD